ncbi:DUF1748-domain-containing protein [Coemansia mojavensis]|nr:DUF1748-domain-containing protein [Coemansia mojavensis]
MFFGRLVHISIDLALVSMVLAGTRRSSGLTPRLDGNGVANSAIRAYLDAGERLLTFAEASMSNSRFFKRT